MLSSVSLGRIPVRRGLGQPCWGLAMPMGPQHTVNPLLRRLLLPLCRAVSACSGCGTRGEGCVVGAACRTGDGVTPRSEHRVPPTPARAMRSGTAPLALRCGQHASECLEKVSKVKISTGTLEKIHESSSQGGVIFKMGPKANPCKGKCLFSFFISFSLTLVPQPGWQQLPGRSRCMKPGCSSRSKQGLQPPFLLQIPWDKSTSSH